MDWILAHAELILITSAVIAFLMAWGMGANDVANAMGTSVGSKALSIRTAIIIAAIFEFAGAYLAGGGVTETISKDIIQPQMFAATPELLIYGMMAAILAAAVWLIAATMGGWPVSTTHTIVGAIVGFAVVNFGASAVNWEELVNIAASWVVSPLLGGTLAFLLLRSVQRLILDTDDPFARAKQYVPYYIGFCGFIMSLITLASSGHRLGLKLSTIENVGVAIVIGLIVSAIGALLLARIKPDPAADLQQRFGSVERIFGVLMVFTACTMAFAHGSNDVANAIGPLAAIDSVIRSGGDLTASIPIPEWVLLVGAVGIVCGLAVMGARVMATVGTKITELTPSRGFAAEMGAATTVVLASGLGLPISTTHTLVGAVLGVGLARGLNSLNLRVIGTIFISWVVTLPAGALLSVIFFFIFKTIFGG